MKKLAYIFFSLLLFACTPAKKDQPQEDKCTEYACPVHRDHTSTESDECPQCGRKMQPVQQDTSKHK